MDYNGMFTLLLLGSDNHSVQKYPTTYDLLQVNQQIYICILFKDHNRVSTSGQRVVGGGLPIFTSRV